MLEETRRADRPALAAAAAKLRLLPVPALHWNKHEAIINSCSLLRKRNEERAKGLLIAAYFRHCPLRLSPTFPRGGRPAILAFLTRGNTLLASKRTLSTRGIHHGTCGKQARQSNRDFEADHVRQLPKKLAPVCGVENEGGEGKP